MCSIVLAKFPNWVWAAKRLNHLCQPPDYPSTRFTVVYANLLVLPPTSHSILHPKQLQTALPQSTVRNNRQPLRILIHQITHTIKSMQNRNGRCAFQPVKNVWRDRCCFENSHQVSGFSNQLLSHVSCTCSQMKPLGADSFSCSKTVERRDVVLSSKDCHSS